MKPSIGRIVHLNTGRGPYAAIVISLTPTIAEDACTLLALTPEGSPLVVPHAREGTIAGTWAWPPRV